MMGSTCWIETLVLPELSSELSWLMQFKQHVHGKCHISSKCSQIKTLISCIRLAYEYSRLPFAPATKRMRGGYSQASDRYKFKQGVNTLSESWILNGNSFFELLLRDLDESLTSADYRRERSKKQRGTVRRADNLFNSFWRPPSRVQVKKSLLLDNFSLRT